jgi:phosphatidylglycerophosphate synthase
MTSVFTAANLLTTLRLILIPIFVSAVCYQRSSSPALKRSFSPPLSPTDLDGLVARTFNQRTPSR